MVKPYAFGWCNFFFHSYTCSLLYILSHSVYLKSSSPKQSGNGAEGKEKQSRFGGLQKQKALFNSDISKSMDFPSLVVTIHVEKFTIFYLKKTT